VFGAIAGPSHRQAGRTPQWIGEPHDAMEALLLRREFEVAPAVCAPEGSAVGHIPVHVRILPTTARADIGQTVRKAGPRITFWLSDTSDRFVLTLNACSPLPLSGPLPLQLLYQVASRPMMVRWLQRAISSPMGRMSLSLANRNAGAAGYGHAFEGVGLEDGPLL
jgi:hypothetical protein